MVFQIYEGSDDIRTKQLMRYYGIVGIIETGLVRTAHGTFYKIPKHCSTIPSMLAESTSFVGAALQYSVVSVCGSSSQLWTARKGRALLSVNHSDPSC